MRSAVSIRPATQDDVVRLTAELRPEDRDEIEMAGFADAAEAVRESFDASLVCFSLSAGDDLLCLFGVTRPQESPDGIGIVWELGTHAIRRHPMAFVRCCRDAVRMLMDQVPQIDVFVNAMPESYKTYRKWAERHLGAAFDPHLSFAPTGTAFRAFSIERT